MLKEILEELLKESQEDFLKKSFQKFRTMDFMIIQGIHGRYLHKSSTKISEKKLWSNF